MNEEEVRIPLFNTGEFQLHSGHMSGFKIDCDALTDDDLHALAVRVAARFRWSSVRSVPRGGDRFSDALRKYSIPALELPRLVVDDVFTTGESMQRNRGANGGSVHDIGIVIFARNPTPEWIHPIFQLWSAS